MFYCNPCAEEQDWPLSFSKSFGACEMCGKVKACNDVPSRCLPPSKKQDPTK
jgi:hypothetical protein